MATWDDMGFGNFPVTEISHTTLTLSDGVDLGIKVWLPCQASEISKKFPYFEKEHNKKWLTEIYAGRDQKKKSDQIFPTILECLPYPKDSWTLIQDHNRHPWFCSHGYVVLRVDNRGSGSSCGFDFDEYEGQEVNDNIEILDWIANQPWSNKAVGMYGKSWSGFNGLQAACNQPPSLKAVISLYTNDDCYLDNMHYQQGTILANGIVSWAAYTLINDARPPHPRYFPSLQDWKAFWLKRLQNKWCEKTFISSWLRHQHPLDPFWSHGEDFSKVKCPVLVIGGLVDFFTNAAFHNAGKLNHESRAIIGPWSHDWPDVSSYGPTINYLNICLRWWNHYLKGESDLDDVSLWPRLSLYCRNSFKCDDVSDVPGKWMDIPNWDSLLQDFKNFKFEDHSGMLPENLNILYFGTSMSLKDKKLSSPVDAVELCPHALQGADAGLWMISDSGFQGDQSTANKNSACWKSRKLQNSIVFAGLSKLYICLSSKHPGKYNIQVRICDQLPSGESTLVTKGCLNLCHYDDSGDGYISTYSGDKKIFCVIINGTGHIFEPDHEVLISISPTYFPSMYPSIDSKGLYVHPEDSFLVFQTATKFKSDTVYPPPKPLLQLPTNEMSKTSTSLTTESLPDGIFQTVWKENSGLVEYPTMNYSTEFTDKQWYTTNEEVNRADMFTEYCLISNFKDDIGKAVTTNVETRLDIGGCNQRIWAKEQLKVLIDGEIFFEKNWDHNIPRKFV